MFLEDPNLSDVDISPREFLKKVEQTVKQKNNLANQSQSSIPNNNSSHVEGVQLFDGTVTQGRQHPPTSIYAQQQYLPYTNHHPNSDFVPQHLNMRYHQPGPPRRMESHESFISMQYYPTTTNSNNNNNNDQSSRHNIPHHEPPTIK